MKPDRWSPPSPRRPTALAVISDLPSPPRSGNHLRYLQNLNLLARLGFDVAVVAGSVRADAGDAGPGPDARLVAQLRIPPSSRLLRARTRRMATFTAGAITRHPRDPFAYEFTRQGFEQLVLSTARELQPDVVLLRSLFASVTPALRGACGKVVADVHDASPLMATMLAKHLPWTARPGLLLRQLAAARADAVLGLADEVWVPSTREFAFYSSRLEVPVVHVPNGIDVPPSAPAREPSSTILLVGDFGWPPNLAAADALVEEVLPRVLTHHADARVTLVGRNLPPDRAHRWQRLPVRWDGFVPDIGAYYRSAAAFVFMPPTVAETALPLKVAEALANALPVVASSGAVGGTSLVSGVHALVADDAESAATALVALLDDDAYRLRVGRAGHRWALENLAPASIAARLATESVLVTRP